MDCLIVDVRINYLIFMYMRFDISFFSFCNFTWNIVNENIIIIVKLFVDF